jgi:hypothetical protein
MESLSSQRARSRRSLRRGAMVATLLQPEVVVGADAGKHRQLLTTQSPNPPPADRTNVDILWAHELTSRAQELPQSRT